MNAMTIKVVALLPDGTEFGIEMTRVSLDQFAYQMRSATGELRRSLYRHFQIKEVDPVAVAKAFLEMAKVVAAMDKEAGA